MTLPRSFIRTSSDNLFIISSIHSASSEAIRISSTYIKTNKSLPLLLDIYKHGSAVVGVRPNFLRILSR